MRSKSLVKDLVYEEPSVIESYTTLLTYVLNIPTYIKNKTKCHTLNNSPQLLQDK